MAGLEPSSGRRATAVARPRPHVRLVAAASLDGKLSDAMRSPARFGSAADRARLEQQVAAVDATLFGAGTLRAYGTTLPVTHPDLLAQRQQSGRPAQPVQIVCSRAAAFDVSWRFFQQPIRRWLLTTATGAAKWQGPAAFEQAIAVPTDPDKPNCLAWPVALQRLAALGIQQLALLGGGELIAAFQAIDAIDEIYLTLCPLLLGGQAAPTLCDGRGLAIAAAPRWRLLNTEAVGDELFLHYARASASGEG